MACRTQKFHRHLPILKRPFLREIDWIDSAEENIEEEIGGRDESPEPLNLADNNGGPTANPSNGPTDSPQPLDLSRSTGTEWISIPSPFHLMPEPVVANEQQPTQPAINIIYKCGICGKHYLSNPQYRAHIRRHESKRTGRYQCGTCKTNFVQRSSLTTHERIHTGERPFGCDVCSQRFGDYSTFTKHLRTHTGEKPYACPVCYRQFSQSGNMHRHLRVVHKNPDL